MPNPDDLRQQQEKLKDLLRKARNLQRSAGGPGSGYAEHRDEMGARSRSQSRPGSRHRRNPALGRARRGRRLRAEPAALLRIVSCRDFYKPWSPDHLKAMAEMQRCILDGGNFAIAMPRAAERLPCASPPRCGPWSTATFRVCFSSVPIAKGRAGVRAINLPGDRTSAWWLFSRPICYPIGSWTAYPSVGCVYRGERDLIRFTRSEIMLPNIPGSPAASGRQSIAAALPPASAARSIRARRHDHAARLGDSRRPADR